MRKNTARCAGILAALMVAFFTCSPVFGWQANVVSVTDGDTIKVLQDGKEIRVRLYGVDTPEKKQPFGQKAKAFTAAMVAGKMVDIETMDRDRYGRLVAVVNVDGQGLNEELVKNGFAWVYRQYCKRAECHDWLVTESTARSARIGLWADQNPIAPWDWRKK